MQYNHPGIKSLLFNLVITIILLTGIHSIGLGQLAPIDTTGLDPVKQGTTIPSPALPPERQYDIEDLARDIVNPKRERNSTRKPSTITIIPNIAANPTIGFQVGIKAVAGKKLGNDPSTFMSIAAASAAVTTKGILYSYITHNIFTAGNKWNLQGSLVAAKMVSPDYGLGIGHGIHGTDADLVLINPNRNGYVLHSLYFNFREKVYKEIRKNLFAGAGVSFDIRKNIEDRLSTTTLTPNNIYSERNGFSNDHYSSNGLLFNVQYTTRDNQNRAYNGMYMDVGFRLNETWLGSTKNAVQFTTDLRKYWSLGTRNPEHVIAFWNWGAYILSGQLPYLELAGTGKDPASRSGRGYKVGYFKGTQYQYSELEYRFPITANKFLSGVAFFHMQTAGDASGTKLFTHWQPGGGAGLRVLFNKATRTNLCLDYAFGKYGSRGFFLGINEAF